VQYSGTAETPCEFYRTVPFADPSNLLGELTELSGPGLLITVMNAVCEYRKGFDTASLGRSDAKVSIRPAKRRSTQPTIAQRKGFDTICSAHRSTQPAEAYSTGK
jgi:hypothetical protein